MKKQVPRFATIALSTFAGAVFLTSPLRAEQAVPENLGLGLDHLVASNIAMQEAQASGKRINAQFRANDGRFYATERAAEFASYGMTDDAGRFIVRVNLAGYKSIEQVTAAISARVPSFEVTATDSYQGGVIAGYVSLDDVPALANTGGVRSVALELQPETNKGAAVAERQATGTQAVPRQHPTPPCTTLRPSGAQHRRGNV